MDGWINNLQQLGALLPSWATAALAVADEFGLHVYQEPSGRDVAALAPAPD
jgi:hypothetical protein